MPHNLGYPLLTVCIRRKMSALRHHDQLSKMFDVVGASGLTGIFSRLSISLISTPQHARRLPNSNWLAAGETAGLFGRVSAVRLCLASRERLIDRVLKGSLTSEDSRLSFALRSFPPNSLNLSFSSRTFLLPGLFTMVATFILTRTFSISALLVGGTSQLAHSHTARVLTECVPSGSAVRPCRAPSLAGSCPLFRTPQTHLRLAENAEILIATQSFDKRFCRQMSCLFEVPTDTTDGPSTEAADTDAQPTKMVSDGTEAVFVAGGIEPEEGDVGDIHVRTSCLLT